MAQVIQSDGESERVRTGETIAGVSPWAHAYPDDRQHPLFEGSSTRRLAVNVNKTVTGPLKWGTKAPIPVIDPKYSFAVRYMSPSVPYC